MTPLEIIAVSWFCSLVTTCVILGAWAWMMEHT